MRKWRADELPSQTRGRGVTQRARVPEPVPEEMLVMMELVQAPRWRAPHLRGLASAFSCLEGAVTIFVAGERYATSLRAKFRLPPATPRTRTATRAQRARDGDLGGDSREGGRLTSDSCLRRNDLPTDDRLPTRGGFARERIEDEVLDTRDVPRSSRIRRGRRHGGWRRGGLGRASMAGSSCRLRTAS